MWFLVSGTLWLLLTQLHSLQPTAFLFSTRDVTQSLMETTTLNKIFDIWFPLCLRVTYCHLHQNTQTIYWGDYRRTKNIIEPNHRSVLSSWATWIVRTGSRRQNLVIIWESCLWHFWSLRFWVCLLGRRKEGQLVLEHLEELTHGLRFSWHINGDSQACSYERGRDCGHTYP